MRVFGVGLSRTGTTSLHRALQILGFRARHYPSLRMLPGRLWIAEGELRRHDALTDLPAARFFRQLDARFPGSRFVLTVRDEEAWLASCERYPPFGPGFRPKRRLRAMRRAVYGTERFDRERFRDAWRAHLAAVREHFRGRGDDLLEMDVTAGEGWETLCPFLGLAVPDAPFPHENPGAAAPVPSSTSVAPTGRPAASGAPGSRGAGPTAPRSRRTPGRSATRGR